MLVSNRRILNHKNHKNLHSIIRMERAFILQVKMFIENQCIAKVFFKILINFLVSSTLDTYLRPPKNYGFRDSGGLHKK